MDANLKHILEKSKSISDIARNLFGNENYTNREKCKKILFENGIDWKNWLKEKREKTLKYCLYCGKLLNGDNRKKFCNQSCSASYNNHKRNKQVINVQERHNCLNCGKELKNAQLTYCSIECQNEYKKNNYIERWKIGKENGQSGVGGVSTIIRRYLFEKYNNTCQLCGWGQKNKYTNKVPLQIHHIDGDCTNNKEDNLQLLCPNCHSLTETYGGNGKHKSKRIDRRKKYFQDDIKNDSLKNIKEVSRCIVCGKELESGQITFCSDKCKQKKQTKNITKEEILTAFKNIENVSYTKVAKFLNISTTCLIKKCENFGIKSEIQKMRYNDEL